MIEHIFRGLLSNDANFLNFGSQPQHSLGSRGFFLIHQAFLPFSLYGAAPIAVEYDVIETSLSSDFKPTILAINYPNHQGAIPFDLLPIDQPAHCATFCIGLVLREALGPRRRR